MEHRTRGMKQVAWMVVAMSVYLCALSGLQGLRSDHYTIVAIAIGLSWVRQRQRVIWDFLWPFVLTAIVYDSQRFYSDWIRGPIHVKEPYWFDKTFFGIQTVFGAMTPNEWCQLHTHPALDVITGFFYLTFIAIFIGIIAYFFLAFRKSNPRFSAESLRMSWGFFWLNVVGYTTYYWYAAAPPWYVAKYGLGPARLDAHASSAGCVRFDQVLGTHFFSEMYGRSADVFGAVPSLHIAYPLLAVYFAFRFQRARIFCLFFFMMMCFSAVYLNHHYVLDILWGSVYAWIAGWAINAYYDATIEIRNGMNTTHRKLESPHPRPPA